jgi:hypothetical protein
MNAKIAKVRIHVNYKGQDVIDTLDVLDKQTHEIVGEHPLASGHLDVQIQRFLELWRIHVFLSKDVLAEKSPVFLKHLKDAVAIFLFGIHSKESYEDAAISFARESSMIKDSPYYQKHPIDDLERAARWTTKSTEKYPLGVPSIISCYQ